MDDSGWSASPLAVIGMACRLPGADQLDDYWRLILAGRCALGPLPAERFDPQLYFDPRKGVLGKSYSLLGGVVAERSFNRAVYPLPDDVLAGSDPVHLAMLEVAGDALRHAGLEPYDVPLRNAGVYIGNARGSLRSANIAFATHALEMAHGLNDVEAFRGLPGDVQQQLLEDTASRLREVYADRAPSRVDLEASRAAGLVADTFGLTGPAMAVDAACASSLVALSLAARALQHGRIELAVVGGASFSGWTSLVLFSQAQAMSAVGSFPFDVRADGFISSDGYAAVVVKTLARALADGDRIWGVIRGLGLSSDGRGKSLWAPRREGQVLAIRRGLACGVDASRIQYVEAHGTSTQVGDATEIEALHEALGPHLARAHPVPVASVKGNIGHTREAAGLAGLIKTLLAMHHGQVPPAAGFETPNPGIPWDTLPFHVPTAPAAWARPEDGAPRRAAVDAFGIGGLNVHLLVDDEPECRTAGARVAAPEVIGTITADRDASAQPAEIAVVGRGAVLPGARTLAVFHELLRAPRDPRSPVPVARWNADWFPAANDHNGDGRLRPLGGFITDFEYDWRKHRIPPKQIAHADPLQFMVLDAAEQALQEAGGVGRGFDRQGMAVVIGTGFGGDFAIQLALALRLPEFERVLRACLAERGIPDGEIERTCAEFAAVFRARYPALEDETASYSSSTLASRVAKTLDLMGGAFSIDAGGGSSLAALSAAVDLLRSRACNAVLCAGAQRGLDPCIYDSYRAQGVLAAAAPRPAFDAAADGFVPGEGCGVVLLKRLADAERDGDRIHGVIRGIGTATIASDRRRAVQTAAARAVTDGAVVAHGVSVIECSGMGVPDVDADEAAGLQACYETPERRRPAWIDDVTSRIGYAHGAAGMASLLKLLAAFGDGRLHAPPSPRRPIERVAGAAGTLRLVEQADAFPVEAGESRLLGAVNTLTLKGQAYHLVVERPAPEAVVAPNPDQRPTDRLFRIEAAHPAELALKLDRYSADGGWPEPCVDAFSTQADVRLAIVAGDRESLARKIDLTRRSLSSVRARPVLEKQGVFVGERRSAPPRIAFAFSGQGSQYPGMLQGLVDESPVAAAHVRELDAVLEKLALPTFEQLAWRSGDKLGRELFETQLSVLLADVLMSRVLASQGVRPDVITAHSFGEYAALVACGAWELEQAIEVTRARCRAITESGVTGGMLATTASIEQAAQLLNERGAAEDVFIANVNAPEQTVVAGGIEAVRRVAEQLQSRGYETRELPVPAPFHTPLMDPVRARLQTELAGIRLCPPVIPFLSSVTNRYTADPLDQRDNLVEQLVKPVRYVELVQRLVGDGVDVVIEVGPRDVLTKLHRQIIVNDGVGLIATDDPQHPGGGQLLRVQAFLECRGVAPAAERPAVSVSASTNGRARIRETVRRARSGPIAHFDATSKRRERNRRSGDAEDRGGTPGDGRRNGAAAGALPTDDLAGVLIRLVCEQTGYPPEVVDLAAELEADLGIDSIKKTQLLGELREHFRLRPSGNLSLDDFPTLRHILNFIREAQAPAEAGAPSATPRVQSERPPGGSPAPILEQTAPRVAGSVPHRAARQAAGVDLEAADALNVRKFSGTPYELGRQHGQAEGDAIRNVLHKYVELLGARLFEMRPLQVALDHRDTYFGAEGLEELRGIADAVGMPVEHVLSFNYGLSMEFLPGCTQFAVTGRWNGDAGLIHAVNEDWMLALALPGTLKRMAQVRFPDGGIPFLTFSTCGELAGQNGINARGLAVSSTLLLDRLKREDGTPGRVHPALVKSILERADSIETALQIVRDLPRSGAWSMCLSQHAADRICYVEYDAESVEVRWAENFVESTNHCLLKTALGETPAQSCQRLDRLHELLYRENGTTPRVTPGQAQAILRDRYDRSLGRVTTHPTKATIRRPYTQASIVMRPATGEVWVTADTLPREEPDRFHRLDLSDLFRSEAVENGPPAQQASLPLAARDDTPEYRAVPDRIMNRFVLRIVDAPLSPERDRPQAIAGRVLLLGDNPTAEALRRQLTESGAEVLTLPAGHGPDRAVERLEQVWAEGPAPTLFLLTARDEEAGCGVEATGWSQRRERGVLLPYLVCQKWVQLVGRANPAAPPRLVGATGLGGDVGLSGRSAAVEGGAVAGLLKAIRHEFPHIATKVVDAPLADPAPLVARRLREEVESAAPDVEVAYVCGRRRVLQPVPRPVVGNGDAASGVAPHGTWIVTGGGRGVTAIIARELGERYGLKLHLIGSSPAPGNMDAWRELTADARRELRGRITQQARDAGQDPAAAWRAVERGLELDANLRAFAADGVATTYHACDVADASQLAAVLDAVRAADGPIHGIIHGAGFEAACRFERKTRAAVSATLAAKVDGAINLAALTRDDPVEFFIGFGSISGRFGGHGQTDYSLSSDLLAKLLCRLRHERPECRAVSVHWPVWAEVGMAMRPESKLALEIAGHKFMPPPEGVAHLLDELEAGAPEGEVLLFDWPAARGTRRSPWTPAEAQEYWRRAPAAAAAPLIEGVMHVIDGQRLLTELEFDPSDPFLAQHRHEMTPILPIVVALEAFAESTRLLQPGAGVAALHDVWIHDGMRFPAGADEHARVEARVRDDGSVGCELRSDFRNRRGTVADPSRLYVSAVVEAGDGVSTATVPWEPPPGPWSQMPYDSEAAKVVQRMIWHGPVFQCLKQFCFSQGTLWGRIVAPPRTELRPGTAEAGWLLPCAVLDACLQACSTLTYIHGGQYHLPQGVKRLQFGTLPATSETCTVVVRLREEREDRTLFDFTLYGDDRRAILDVEEYHAAIIAGRKGTP